MKEHEKLKIICDKIGHNPEEKYSDFHGYIRILGPTPSFNEPLPPCDLLEVSLREIIFTSDFMNKLKQYNEDIKKHLYMFDIDLDNPVDYIFHLLNEYENSKGSS